MPSDPLEGQNNSPRRFGARMTFLGQALPPAGPKTQKHNYDPVKEAEK